MIRFVLIALAVLALSVAGCRSKGPTPKEGSASQAPAPVGSNETSGAHPGPAERDPHAGLDMPGAAPPGSGSSGQPDASGVIEVGAVAFQVPDAWKAQAPRSAMRRAQLIAPGSAGDAELVIYYFGQQGAGAARANVDRWIGQFSKPDGSPVENAKETQAQIAGFDVVKVDVQGRYVGGMGQPGQAQAPKADQRLLAAIVSTGAGPYYFKFLGPTATVTEQAKAFDQLLASLRAP